MSATLTLSVPALTALRDGILVQNACNLSGIVLSLAAYADQITPEEDAQFLLVARMFSEQTTHLTNTYRKAIPLNRDAIPQLREVIAEFAATVRVVNGDHTGTGGRNYDQRNQAMAEKLSNIVGTMLDGEDSIEHALSEARRILAAAGLEVPS